MSLLLFSLAMIAAANPARASSARPTPADTRTIAAALATMLVLTAVAAVGAGPFLDLVDVTGPSARIAAGIALLVVALKDVFTRPPAPEPALEGWRGGIVPLGFPVIYSPAVALVAVAGSASRGVGFVILGAGFTTLLLGLSLMTPTSASTTTRIATATIGLFGAGIAALVVLDGVYAI